MWHNSNRGLRFKKAQEMRGKDELIERVGNGQFAPKEAKPKRKVGRPFVKGDPRCGRPKGTPNKATTALKEFLRQLVDDPVVQAGIRDRIARGDTPGFFRAVEHVLGKPKETVDSNLTGELTLKWQDE